MEEHQVYLGFVEKPEEPLTADDFPDRVDGKIGGRPNWLDAKNLPNDERTLCPSCKNILPLLLQIYAPIEENDAGFHRTLYIFCCKNADCHKPGADTGFKVFRSQLPKENDLYVPTEDEYFRLNDTLKNLPTVCQVCGHLGSKRCGSCKSVHYCSREHQVLHWKASHSKFCENPDQSPANDEWNHFVFPEFLLVTERELPPAEGDSPPSAEEPEKRNVVVSEKVDSSELEEFEECFAKTKVEDKAYLNFQKTVKNYPDQCIRYYASPNPPLLWVSEEGKPEPAQISVCPNCKSPRQAEFQVLPQLLYHLKVDDLTGKSLDWGVLTVYTCANHCNILPAGGGYAEEFVWVQNFSE